ncbi:MAG: GTPase Era [Bacteroidetes bacterium]|nr:GTPase Era [Bacteroidota bacterium]
MKTKAGYVTIIGKPNAGKSTLMNALMGEKLSIVTSKAQTTRKRILGILSKEDYQIVFLDTPGILNPQYLLQEKMMEYVNRSVRDGDVILLLVDISEDRDGSKLAKDDKIMGVLKNYSGKMILLINKIDLSNEKEVEAIMKSFMETTGLETVIPISALKNFNTERIIQEVVDRLPEHPKFYPDDQIAEDPERFFVEEIIRGKIFAIYSDEVPYSCEVGIEEFKERENNKDYISAFIYVERESQKPIIIGKGGETIKRLGKYSREAIEEFLQREVYLELRVKVRAKWRSEEKYLRNFGYSTDND